MFTALHRVLGYSPGPLTDNMLDEAIEQGIAESADLDWKREVYEQRSLRDSDYPKDVAAMANAGGGLIVFGIVEERGTGRAKDRHDIGAVSESYERTLRSVAVSAITPPVFDLGIYRLGQGEMRALIVEVPTSTDGPHLVYKNDLFGAPVRNGSETVWMRERQIEQMYHARFDQRRRDHEDSAVMYEGALTAHPATDRPWLIGVGRPHLGGSQARIKTREEAQAIASTAQRMAKARERKEWQGDDGWPLGWQIQTFRPGLRRWIGLTRPVDASPRAVRCELHDDGAVTLAASLDKARSGPSEPDRDDAVKAFQFEEFVSALAGLAQANARLRGFQSYELTVGLDWNGTTPLALVPSRRCDQSVLEAETADPLVHFTTLTATLSAATTDDQVQAEVCALARDCLSQVGLRELHVLRDVQDDVL